MEFVTITFDRVFEVHRYAFKARAFTQFSFQAGGLTQYAVHVPGSPRIEAGDTVTALLAKPVDWLTVRGWRNWSSGELALPQRGTTLASTSLCALAGPAFLWLSTDPSPATTFARVIGSALVLLGVYGTYQLFRETSDVRLLRGLRQPANRVATADEA